MAERFPPSPQKMPMTAQRLVMDLLGRRDHSAKELREKLAEKFPAEEIEAAIRHALESHWLPDEAELAHRIADRLHHRAKGILAINSELAEKGLPPEPADPERELEKAVTLAQTRWNKSEPPDEVARQKIGRFLVARGFEADLVRKVIYEKL